MSGIVVCALYRFVRLDDYRALRTPLLDILEKNGIYGTLLLAGEGINGTVAGSRAAINTLLDWFRRDARLADIDCKESLTDTPPFKHSKVKLKREIVTLGVPGIDPNRVVGTYVEPADWNDLISDPEVLLIDTRNDYEVRVGTFRNAANPATGSFREFPEYVNAKLDPAKHRKVAMFCTGGIRCEKATAFLKQQGFDEVFHLKGGILKYLEDTCENDSLWEGECFVFDERVTVNHRLERGQYNQCNACRMPVSEADMASEFYEQGVSCPHCHDRLTAKQKARFAERERQMQLAQDRSELHMGSGVNEIMHQRRARKRQEKQQQRTTSKQQNDTPST
jgi:UPF0176 protein